MTQIIQKYQKYLTLAWRHRPPPSLPSRNKTEAITRSSQPEAFLGKDVPKICSKFTGKHSCRSVISIKLLCNFIKIALQHLFIRTPLEGCFSITVKRSTKADIKVFQSCPISLDFLTLLRIFHQGFQIYEIWLL